MIDKYRLDDLRLESGEKGELARWVIQLQRDLDSERRKDGNSPVIGVDLASGTDRTAEVRYFAPPGYVLVPIEPTTNQWAAGMQAFDSGMDKVTRVYKAMIAAAPQQEAE